MASQRTVLRFPQRLIDEPIISRLVRQYDLEFNILRANITPESEGLMVLELSGDARKLKDGLEYIQSLGVRAQRLAQNVSRDEAVCTHCGACVTICPVQALFVEAETRKVLFDADKCIACELCVPVCPPRAMMVEL